MEAGIQELFGRGMDVRVQGKEKPSRLPRSPASRTGGCWGAGAVCKEGRGFSVFGAEAPALGQQEICLEEINERGKARAAQVCG